MTVSFKNGERLPNFSQSSYLVNAVASKTNLEVLTEYMNIKYGQPVTRFLI